MTRKFCDDAPVSYEAVPGLDDPRPAVVPPEAVPAAEVTCQSCDGARYDVWGGNPDRDCTVCHGSGVVAAPAADDLRAVETLTRRADDDLILGMLYAAELLLGPIPRVYKDHRDFRKVILDRAHEMESSTRRAAPAAEAVLKEIIEWAHRQKGVYPDWMDRARKAVGEFDGDPGAAPAADDLRAVNAAVAEYNLQDTLDDQYLGRRAAVRGMMVRLGLYAEFNAALRDAQGLAEQFPESAAQLPRREGKG